jgi:hypothetical protein
VIGEVQLCAECRTGRVVSANFGMLRGRHAQAVPRYSGTR